MGKKSKKRQLKDDSNENERINATSLLTSDAPNKAKKIKISSEKSEKKKKSSIIKSNDLKSKKVSKKEEIQNSSNKLTIAPTVIEGETLKKKLKEQGKSVGDKITSSDSKNKDAQKLKRKELLKKKRAEFKEKQKLLGFRKGITASVDKLSLTEMKEKIAEIESRNSISKTAARKLRILKKKVEVQESGSREKDGIPEKNIKNKLPNKTNVNTMMSKVDTNKNIDKKKQKKEKSNFVKDLRKNLFIEDKVGSLVANDSADNSNEEQNELNINKFTKKVEKLKNKFSGTSNIKSNESDSDFKENDEDSDECENGNNEETNDVGGINNNLENEENDKDDNDIKSDSQNIEKSKTTVKKKEAQNKANKNSNKPESKPIEKDAIKKQRYVLFVKNIAYDTTTVDLKKHFLTKVEKVKDVRIPLHTGTNKPRGFAYVEVENSEDYEKALSLHNTFIKGRQLKVEYTTSGSKKASRNHEVIHKNKKLHALRKEGKLAGSKKFSQKRSFRRNFKNNPKKNFG